MRRPLAFLLAGLALCGVACGQTDHLPLADADIVDIATILRLEDTRQFDEGTLQRLLDSKHTEVRRRAVVAVGRIADPLGSALLEPMREDPSADIVASVAFAAGQLKDPAAIAWLSETLLASATPGSVAMEAARALGKIRTPEAWAALSSYLTSAAETPASGPVVGEALLSIGRFTTREDVSPIVKWTSAKDGEVRWRAAWALFRPRNPAAVPHLLKLSEDESADVRFWAVRGLAMPTAAASTALDPDGVGVDREATAERLRAAVKDDDRRVRTEALRALGGYDDDASFGVVLAALDDPDTWMSVSAAEVLGRFTDRASVVEPKLRAATEESRPAALRTVAAQQLTRLTAPPADPAGRGRGAGAGRGGRGGGQGTGTGRPAVAVGPERSDADYRAIVERWIVPAYNGAPAPRAIWMTPKGEIEMELHAGDAPLGMEELVRLTESGDLVGTVFSRVVPNFVAQQATIRGANRLRDEVSRLGLTRGNLSWASSGLDTGRPGYTLGSTPQPHNEGDFTALGTVVRGMDVVDRLELGDAVTAARMVK